MRYMIYTQFNPGIGTTNSHTLIIIDVYDEHGEYTGKILAKSYEDLNHGKSMWLLTQVLVSALNTYNVPLEELMSWLKQWFDEVSYKEADKDENL